MTDITRVGLYGLTYKENVDDMRESPTLQLLESQERHLATGLKVYDPFIKKDVVKIRSPGFSVVASAAIALSCAQMQAAVCFTALTGLAVT